MKREDTVRFRDGSISTLAYARNFAAAGWSVVPILRDGSKASAVPWKRYQTERAADELLRKWFARPEPLGIGLVHGLISGCSEVIDVDRAELWEDFYSRACDEIPSLIYAPGIQTPRPGNQLVYRCATRRRGISNWLSIPTPNGAKARPEYLNGKPQLRLEPRAVTR